MYGKKSAARYRLESCAESAEYEENPPESQKVSNINNRYGVRLAGSRTLSSAWGVEQIWRLRVAGGYMLLVLVLELIDLSVLSNEKVSR
jgi:hypothetical protein